MSNDAYGADPQPQAVSLTFVERAVALVSPEIAMKRVQARLALDALRHFEAAQPSRRTDGWTRKATDANMANGPALGTLRNLARDLVRNNPYAKRAKQIVTNNTVGYGLVAKADHESKRVKAQAAKLWRRWATTTACDYDGQHTLAGIQRLAMGTIAESGEALIRRYYQTNRAADMIPIKLQVLEPDHLDTNRNIPQLPGGGKIVHGVEFDADGQRVAYWLFPVHPGGIGLIGASRIIGNVSHRVPASDVRHVFYRERPGQVRGYSWYAPALVKLKDFDEYEDAALLKQKIAACLAVFVTDTSSGPIIGQGVQRKPGDPTKAPALEMIQPGQINRLSPGQSVASIDPPSVPDGEFDARCLRAIAAGLGVTFEDLTGDYSRVNFSSARMGRLAHWANVDDWRWNMLVPGLCDPIWNWAFEAAEIAGMIADVPTAIWTAPPMPVIEPDREAKANMLRVRAGQATPDQILRESGEDPDQFWAEYEANMAMLKERGIIIDSDPRFTTQVGQPAMRNKGAKQVAT